LQSHQLRPRTTRRHALTDPLEFSSHALQLLAILSIVMSASAFKIDASPPSTTPKLVVTEKALNLRGGGTLGTPFSPLELAEASMGAIYWVNIALLPKVWAKTNLGVEMDPVASTITTLMGAILFWMRAAAMLVRAKAPELKKDMDAVAAIGWAYTCSTLFLPGNAWASDAFVPNLVINAGFSIAFGLRYLGVF
jgi:hypothetical protein